MGGILAFAYGLVAYAVFLVSFLYAVGFVTNLAVPKTIDSGPAAPLGEALLVNVILLGIFAIQHSVMARPAFKRWWTRIVPASVERSTFVLLSSLILLLLFWQWRPIAQPVWAVADPNGMLVLNIVMWAGWALVFIGTWLINHFELFGLQQVYCRLMNRPMPAPKFRTPLFYRWVRHPIMLGFLLAFWATPSMSQGHLLFAIATAGYIVIGVLLEERDLTVRFGDPYRRYREQVGMLIPLLGRAKRA